MSPFTPHICEEMWEKLGRKPFVSLAKWPKHNEKKIDEKAEAEENLTTNLHTDIINLLKLVKIKKIKNIRLYVSPRWKYDFFRKIKKELEKTRDVKAIMTSVMKTPLKKHGKDVSRMISAIIKNPSKVPVVVLDQKTEEKQLNDYKKHLEKEYKCKVKIELADKSKEAKAKNANPGKPAIVIE